MASFGGPGGFFDGFSAELEASRSRQSVAVGGDTVLNVERWATAEAERMVIYVHGVCESAETVTVARLAAACLARQWELCVVELEGHGLSSGARGVCASFDGLVDQITDAVRHLRTGRTAPWALCGSSLGGTLAAYVADRLVASKKKGGGEKKKKKKKKNPDDNAATDDDADDDDDDDADDDAESAALILLLRRGFVGAALVAPAVGVDERQVPGAFITGALRFAALVAPSASLPLTPLEDPSHYACPPSSKRNFSGHWPLATSRMLLDLTATRVPADQREGALTLRGCPVLVVTGTKDRAVPFAAQEAFFQGLASADKRLVHIKGAGHDLTVDPDHGPAVCTTILDWLDLQANNHLPQEEAP